MGRILPVIGISCSLGRDRYGEDQFRLNADYVRSVQEAGGSAIILPHRPPLSPHDNAACDGATGCVRYGSDAREPAPAASEVEKLAGRVIELIDGLLLAGGGDVSPDLFGVPRSQGPWCKLKGVDRERDDFEIALVRAARDRGIPVFAICRGVQVLNVAFGGTLILDIPCEVGDGVCHDGSSGQARSQGTHAVAIEPGTRLWEILGGRSCIKVNSFHHQAVARPGEGLCVAATCPQDNVIEALEVAGDGFCIGVQWHPEAMTREDETARLLFRAFVDAASAR